MPVRPRAADKQRSKRAIPKIIEFEDRGDRVSGPAVDEGSGGNAINRLVNDRPCSYGDRPPSSGPGGCQFSAGRCASVAGGAGRRSAAARRRRLARTPEVLVVCSQAIHAA